MMDRALWITWYDLPEAGRDDYFRWLHETYLPLILKMPGYLWAAHYAQVEKEQRASSARESGLRRTGDATLPKGSRYILIFGAEDANIFGAADRAGMHAGLSDADRRMLAMRQGERVNIMVEAARVAGPAAQDYADGMALAPCIQLGNFNCAWQDEDDILAWYAKWRMPAMRTLTGCIRTRRLASVAGWAKHGVLYEFPTLELRNHYFMGHEDHDPGIKAWSDRMVDKLMHAPGSSTLAVRIWPPVKG